MVEGILFLVDVGRLSGTAAAGVFIDVGVLVYDIFGHELLLIGFLDALFPFELVLIAVFAVGYDGACLAILGQHLHDGILDVLNLKNVGSGEILFLAQREHLVSIFAGDFLVVALVANGVEVFQNGDLNLCQVERHYLAVALLYLDHGNF